MRGRPPRSAATTVSPMAEAATQGIGAMNAPRIADFYAQMVKAGLYKPGDVDLSKVATLQFVNKRVGQDIKAKLTSK